MCRQSFHLWDQSWVERDFDGPGLVSRIAVAARELEPLAEFQLPWERLQDYRRGRGRRGP